MISRLLLTTAICAFGSAVFAFEPAPEGESLEKAFPGKSYSPYAERGIPDRPLWGDTHLHTSTSFDAGSFGNRLDARAAYRFAKGEQVTSSTGVPARLSRPLDWLVIADHSDNMGLFDMIFAQDRTLTASPEGRDLVNAIAQGGTTAVEATLSIIESFGRGELPAPNFEVAPGTKEFRSVWQRQIAAAEEANDPGNFTALIGYEWTSTIDAGNNMHRVVIYRDGGEVARMVDPATTAPPLGNPNPRYLWDWMENYEETTRGDVLALAHNGNLSNGIMFPVEAQFDGVALDTEYVQLRAKWEPLYEVTQIKGDGEAHPFLSPNDEFADYGTWDKSNLGPVPKEADMLQYEYAREALKNGMVLEDRLGTNPYKFGMIGSTDSHTSLAAVQEDNFFGKHSGTEPDPERPTHVVGEFGDIKILGWEQVASGLAAVWAEENTREAIFDAMERKEVYATTGSRIGVRFFGGWDFTAEDMSSRTPATAGYAKGVPMGGNLTAAPSDDTAPTFMVFALKDPIGANLDRIQIVKGWVTEDGETQEQVYDVVWAGDRTPDADGNLPAVGSTVDVERATWTNTIGRGEMGTVWTDPDFDPAQPAFYYARVIEIPTPRWTAYDAFRLGADVPEDSPMTTQERAYTSPIWYTPDN